MDGRKIGDLIEAVKAVGNAVFLFSTSCLCSDAKTTTMGVNFHVENHIKDQ